MVTRTAACCLVLVLLAFPELVKLGPEWDPNGLTVTCPEGAAGCWTDLGPGFDPNG